MNKNVDDLLRRINGRQDELEEEYRKARESFRESFREGLNRLCHQYGELDARAGD